MKDALDQEISVGDLVVITEYTQGSITFGIVKDVRPKSINYIHLREAYYKSNSNEDEVKLFVERSSGISRKMSSNLVLVVNSHVSVLGSRSVTVYYRSTVQTTIEIGYIIDLIRKKVCQ